MQQVFISVVNVIHSPRDVSALKAWLEGLYQELKSNFSDFEFVLVNNGTWVGDIDAAISSLPEPLRQHIFLLNLSSRVDRSNALLAALDRSNGDYTAIFEFNFAHQPQLLTQMFNKSKQDNFDVVYLSAKERRLPLLHKLLYRIFYFILKRYSGLKIDPSAHHTRVISRRALNSLLRLRENSHYIKANFAMVGYSNTAIEVDEPLTTDMSLAEQFRTALIAITSFTDFLRTVLFWIFIFSFIVAFSAIVNAVKVKLTNIDIFGDPQPVLTGWAFLVVMISSFFAITCLNLYIMSIYLSNIYAEIKNRPLYIIESVKRY
jgi:Glycosyl transferase family 2